MNKLLIVVAIVLLLLILVYLWASGGPMQRNAPAWLTERPIAHRGLWSDGPEAPQNSLAAFESAVESDYAIELDAQMTSDGFTVVVHDANLKAMTGQDRLVGDTSLLELTDMRLLGGEETIPTLEEVLHLVDGRVPVFVEIKNPGEVGDLEDDVARQLADYDGEAAVMSFNPYSLARVQSVAPEIPRGQLSSAFEGEDLQWYEKLLLRSLAMDWTSHPDFIAYDLKELPNPAAQIQRWWGRPLLGWTVEDADDVARAKKYCDGMIANPGGLKAAE
jgi:glycerophosphoryl diester phosphodiesterase